MGAEGKEKQEKIRAVLRFAIGLIFNELLFCCGGSLARSPYVLASL